MARYCDSSDTISFFQGLGPLERWRTVDGRGNNPSARRDDSRRGLRLGRIIATLDALHILDKTVIVLSSGNRFSSVSMASRRNAGCHMKNRSGIRC
jgi:hypothetical protein